jgi:hypothetical protein
MFVAVATVDDLNTFGTTLAVVPDEHRRVYMRVEVVSIEEAPTVFLGPRGEFVELPILEVSDLRGHHGPPLS